MKIYHNPSCSKSREALKTLNDNNCEITIVEYLKSPLNYDELRAIIDKLGIKAEALIRKNEAIFKSDFKGKELTEEEWVNAMVKYPKLIERPIVIKGNKAVIGRPVEKVLDLI